MQKTDKGTKVKVTATYLEAQECAIRLGIKTSKEWYDAYKEKRLPSNMPSQPSVTYKSKGWDSWHIFLQIPKKIFLSYVETREYLKQFKFQTIKEYRIFAKSDVCPHALPIQPDIVYGKIGTWVSIDDFLGKNTIVYATYDEAKKFLKPLELVGQEGYQTYLKTNKLEINLPYSPHQHYQDKWVGWTDFLGIASHIARNKKKYLPYDMAKKYVQSIGTIKSQKDWTNYLKSGEKPDNIPSSPALIYKNNGWISWGDWFGTNTVSAKERVYMPLEELKKYVKSLNLTNIEDWKKHWKQNIRPNNIPAKPNIVYKDNGWISWGDFLGTGYIASSNRKYLSYEEARKFVSALGFTSYQDWRNYLKSGQKPDNIPATPEKHYKGKGWINIFHFLGCLGNGKHRWQKSQLLHFLENIKTYMHQLGALELLTIIHSNKVSKKIQEIGLLNQLLLTSPNSDIRSQIVDDIFEAIDNSNDTDSNEDENIGDTLEFQPSIIDDLETELSPDLLPTTSVIDDALVYDDDNIISSFDEENILFIQHLLVNKMWNEVLNAEGQCNLDLDKLNGKFSSVIKDIFLREFEEIQSYKLPTSYNFRDKNGELMLPTTMQWLICSRLNSEKSYGNFSDTGAGKTLSAILPARMFGKNNVLIICNKSTINMWVDSINSYFTGSNIYVKSELENSPSGTYNVIDLTNIQIPTKENNYIILNYESFQQETSPILIQHLVDTYQSDYVILDEVQYIKKRDKDVESLRRTMVTSLVESYRKSIENLFILCMSATPIVNNLTEGRMLIELITGKEHSELDTTMGFSAALEMHKALTRCGVRFCPEHKQILNTNISNITDTSDLSRDFNEDFSPLAIDRISIPKKLEAMKSQIKSGTVIYTHYVQGIIPTIVDYVESMGLSCGVYTGKNKNGLLPFKNKQVDVLIASSPISTGVDGLQFVCNNLIILSLPWTFAEYRQLIGRFRRKKSIFSEVNVHIPFVFFGNYSFDKHRYNTISSKKTLCDFAVDGVMPTTFNKSEQELRDEAKVEIGNWIDRLSKGDVYKIERKKIAVPLLVSQPIEVK